MDLQSYESLNFGNFGTPTWESRDKNDIWVLALWPCTNNTIKEKVVAFPKFEGRGESCESVFARGESVHKKCFNYALTNLLFGLCRHVRIIDLLVTLPSPYPEALACPSTPEVLRVRERTPTLHSSVVFTLDSHLNLLKSLGVHQDMFHTKGPIHRVFEII